VPRSSDASYLPFKYGELGLQGVCDCCTQQEAETLRVTQIE
jgi:hypothetical protein